MNGILLSEPPRRIFHEKKGTPPRLGIRILNDLPRDREVPKANGKEKRYNKRTLHGELARNIYISYHEP